MSMLADVGHTAAGARHALDDDVEDPLVLEDATDLDPLQERCFGPPHRAGRDPEPLRLGEVDLDLDGGLGGRGQHARAR